MQIIIKGEKWGVIYCPLSEIPVQDGKAVLGLCDYENKTLFIADSIKGESKLQVIAHETIHAIKKSLTEKEVDAIAVNVAKVLWKIGYRKIE